jgi:hypothetical protein
MLLSVALYAGLLLFLAGLPLLIWPRTRRAAAFGLLSGVLLIVIAFAWPISDEHATVRATHLDEIMPTWQFRERHVTRVAAPPERAFASIRPVTADEIWLFRTLTAIRRLGRPLPAGVMNAPKSEPLLDIATRTSFRYLANDPPHEIVVGTIIVPPRLVLATMNFLVTPDGSGGSLLSTETRVLAANDSITRRFAIYWRFIHPGSDIIRRMWLRAIKKRAETAH